jgi:hypothetical protein
MSKRLLNQIEKDPLERLYISLLEQACFWAAAGFLSEAETLLQTLWGCAWPTLEDGYLYHGAFDLIWQTQGQDPFAVPFPRKSVAEIEKDTWLRLFGNQWSESFLSQFQDQDWQALRGNPLRVKGILLAESDPEAALAALSHFFATEKAIGYNYFQASACGAILAARVGKQNATEEWLLRWGQGYLDYPENYLICYLLRERSTARLLLKGLLAPLWKLKAKKLSSLKTEIDAALAARFA